MPVPLKNPKGPDDNLPNMVAYYNLGANTFAVNLDQMKYVLLSKKEQDHCGHHYATNVMFRVQYVL